MEQPTARRRLVKSPPELWAEVSSERALGRRLAEFGEIRITRVEPETTVAWEGERASGTVELAAADWGTQVILTATLAEQSRAFAVGPEPEATAALQPSPPERDTPTPATPAAPTALQRPPPQPDAPATPPRRPRRGFFARLFRRRPKAPKPLAAPRRSTAPEPAPGRAAEPLDVPVARHASPPAASDLRPPAPGPEPPPPAPDPAPTLPEPVAAPLAPVALDAERTVAILTAVLDDLGASHHRSSRTTGLFSPT